MKKYLLLAYHPISVSATDTGITKVKTKEGIISKEFVNRGNFDSIPKDIIESDNLLKYYKFSTVDFEFFYFTYNDALKENNLFQQQETIQKIFDKIIDLSSSFNKEYEDIRILLHIGEKSRLSFNDINTKNRLIKIHSFSGGDIVGSELVNSAGRFLIQGTLDLKNLNNVLNIIWDYFDDQSFSENFLKLL